MITNDDINASFTRVFDLFIGLDAAIQSDDKIKAVPIKLVGDHLYLTVKA